MSKSTEDATIQYVRNVKVAIDNVDRGETIELKDLNQSSDKLNEVLNEETKTSFNSHQFSNMELPKEPYTLQTRRNLERAHKSVNTITRQITITGAKIEATNEQIAELKQEKDNPDTSQVRKEEIDSKISELEEENNVQKQVLQDLKPVLRNQLVAIQETLYKVLYEDKTLGEKLRTLFTEQGVTIASILTAIVMAVSNYSYVSKTKAARASCPKTKA